MFAHLLPFVRHRTAVAVGAIFALQGLLFGTWAALIPFVKHKFGLDEAQLGLLLLSLQGGVLIMNPFSVPILHRLGAPDAAVFSMLTGAVFFAVPMFIPSIPPLAAIMFLAGAAFASVNVAINTCASTLEHRDSVRIMSTCHGLWSAGAMTGSALTGMAVGLGAVPGFWSAALSAVVFVLSWWLRPRLANLHTHTQEEKTEGGGQKFAWPSAALWLIISISLCTNVTEGTMADWSAVFMRDVIQSEPYTFGWGFAAYAFFMAAGRFIGDGLLTRYGTKRVLGIGGAIAASGLILLAVFPQMPLALCWFAMVGAGVSLGAPILYAAAAKAPGMAKGAGLATMNTFAMVGFFGGPVFIGFLAKLTNLQVAFATVGAGALYWAWQSRRI